MRERGFRRSLLIAALAADLARSATSPPQHALDERPAEATTPAARVREPPHARRCWDDTLEGSFLQTGSGARPAKPADWNTAGKQDYNCTPPRARLGAILAAQCAILCATLGAPLRPRLARRRRVLQLAADRGGAATRPVVGGAQARARRRRVAAEERRVHQRLPGEGPRLLAVGALARADAVIRRRALRALALLGVQVRGVRLLDRHDGDVPRRGHDGDVRRGRHRPHPDGSLLLRHQVDVPTRRVSDIAPHTRSHPAHPAPPLDSGTARRATTSCPTTTRT